MSDPTSALTAVLQRFADDDVRHAVPAFVFDLLVANPALEIPSPLDEILLGWMQKRGLTAETTPEEVRAALDASYRERPINPELLAALNGLLTALAGESAAGGFKGFLGEKMAPTVPDAGPAPAGAVKANPLARFNIAVPPKSGTKP